MNKKPSQETGQILVIFAVALVALLAFAALAIDSSTIYVNRRYSQSVADTASLAGAGAAALYLEKNGISWENFSCSNPYVITSFTVAYNAARNRAAINQVTSLDQNLSDKNGIEVLCVNHPDQFDKHIDVHTMVTSTVNTSLIQIVYPSPIKNTVNAVVRIHPRTELGYGRAVVSLSDACGTNTGGVVFDGTSDVYINGGGVYSNSCIDASGNVRVGVINDGIEYVGELTTNGHPVLSPAPTQNGYQMPRQPIWTPNCGSSPAISHNGGGTISPGNYSQIKLTSNATLTLEPGLYCLTGDFEAQGGEILGDGVSIYMKKDGNRSTNLTINGGVTVHLNAPTDTNVVSGAKVGMLIYMADGNTGNVNLLGNAGSSFTGAVYAPDATIDVGGTTGVNPTYNTQLMGKYVKVHGTAEIDINFHTFPTTTEEPKLDAID